jgi:ankyrin repeat protein
MDDKDIVEILLSKGADVNVTNNDGMTALHYGE